MSQSHPPLLPADLEPPDVGFVTAVGVYVAVLSVAVAITGTLAVDGSSAAVVGSISSAATFGLVVGALLASRVDGLPERLGRRPRSLALPFVVPTVFALATLFVVLVSAIPAKTALGTGLGALGTFVAALGIVSMARTRYARAMTSDEPALTISRLRPNAARRSVGIGIASLLAGVALGLTASPAGTVEDNPASWLLAAVSGFAVAVGVAFVLVGNSYRVQFDDRDGESRLHRLLPDRTKRSVFGTDWSVSAEFDRSHLPTLRIHDDGLVVEGSLGHRFVPWGDVTAVRLTDSALIVEHRGRFDVRCARAVLDDPETMAEALERRYGGKNDEADFGSRPERAVGEAG